MNSPVKECDVHGILGSLVVGIPVIGEIEVSIEGAYMHGEAQFKFSDVCLYFVDYSVIVIFQPFVG